MPITILDIITEKHKISKKLYNGFLKALKLVKQIRTIFNKEEIVSWNLDSMKKLILIF